ncbi:IclR family transcriptional regulator, partial [Glycomyces tenuis]|uniref:IclR family transcriptional regulator n=1 Tax=Glycomyces tenuis TaxID=58116 RepID=UPI00068D67DE
PHPPARRYATGSRIAQLAANANALLGLRARPVLRDLARELGETANLAMLSSDAAEYIAQVAGTHSIRMFTEVGHRAPLHSTGVGKALLSQLPEQSVRRLLGRAGMRRHTPNTIVDLAAMLTELDGVRGRGYAVDDSEMELGVRCVAVPFFAGLPYAVSVSGPEPRMTDELLAKAARALALAADKLRAELDDAGARDGPDGAKS